MFRVVAIAVASVLVTALAQAQAAPTVGARAQRSILLDVGSNTLIGLGLRSGERTDVLIEVGGRVSDDGSSSTRVVLVRPALKRYLGSTERSVAPYLLLGLRADWTRLESGGSLSASTRRLGGMIGVGVDWFPAQRVSVGGHVGAEALTVRREGPVFPPATDAVTTGHDVGTLASGLRFRLFF